MDTNFISSFKSTNVDENEFKGMLPNWDAPLSVPFELHQSLALRNFQSSMRPRSAADMGTKDHELREKPIKGKKDSRDLIYAPMLYRPLLSYAYSYTGGDSISHTVVGYPSNNDYDQGLYGGSAGIAAIMGRCEVLVQKYSPTGMAGMEVATDDYYYDVLPELSDDEVALHVYDITMYNEVVSSPLRLDYVKNQFREMKSFEEVRTLYGKVFSNTIVHMNLFDNEDEKTKRDLSIRMVKPIHRYFLDCTYTPTSLEAGVIRACAHGVVYRPLTTQLVFNTIMMLKIGRLCDDTMPESSKTWTLFSLGVATPISAKAVAAMGKHRMTQIGPHNCSLWIYKDKKLAVVSISPGCMMRPIYVDERAELNSSKVYLDNVMFHSGWFVDSSQLAKVEADFRQACRTLVWMIPYISYTMPPRPLLGSLMMVQAIADRYVELSSTVRPVKKFKKLVISSYCKSVLTKSSSSDTSIFPGVPLIVAYVSCKWTIEDGIAVSDAVNRMGLFNHEGFVRHPVGKHAETLKVGDKVTKDMSFYRCADEGIVTRIATSDRKSAYATIVMKSRGIQDADKLATYFGQKGVVTVVPETEMFECYDPVSGLSFKPHVIMSWTSISNRVTYGQLCEGWRAVDLVGDRLPTFDPNLDYGTVTDDGPLPSQKYCYIKEPGANDYVEDVFSDRPEDDTLYLKADYGIVNFLPLVHLARDKQHFSSRYRASLKPKRGRADGSSVKEGEYEMRAMLSKGLIHCLQEDADQSDLAVVDCCSGCNTLCCMCVCPPPKPTETYQLLMRYSLVVEAMQFVMRQLVAMGYGKEMVNDCAIADELSKYELSLVNKTAIIVPRFYPD